MSGPENPEDSGRDPWFIHLSGDTPFSFAGLWAQNDRMGITSCTIITAPAAEPIKRLHDRQPVILDPTWYDAWLDPVTPREDLKPLLAHDLDGMLAFHRVGREVNATRGGADHAGLIARLEAQ